MAPWALESPSSTLGLQGGIKNAYLPPGGFSKWLAKLQGVSSGGTAVVWGLGASLAPLGGGGTAVTDMLTKPSGVLFRNTLINTRGYPLHGDTFLPTASSGANGFNNLVSYSAPPWVMDVAPTSWSFFGPFTMPIWNIQATMPLAHAIHPSAALGYNARSARVFYFDVGNQDGGGSSAGRTWDATETVDSVTHTQTEAGDHLIHTVDFTNLSNNPNHRINFGNQSALSAFSMFLVAVAWYPTTTIPTSGVHFAWFGMPGNTTMGDLMRTDGTAPKLRIERMFGPSNTPTGDPPASLFTANSALAVPWQPNLVLMDEYDDFAFVNTPTVTASTPTFTVTGAPSDAYGFGLARLFNIFRLTGTCDVGHIFPAIPDSYVSDVTVGNNNQWNIKRYFAERRMLGELYGHGWMNLDNIIGETGLAQGYLSAGNPHLTNAGQAFEASLFTSLWGL